MLLLMHVFPLYFSNIAMHTYTSKLNAMCFHTSDREGIHCVTWAWVCVCVCPLSLEVGAPFDT